MILDTPAKKRRDNIPVCGGFAGEGCSFRSVPDLKCTCACVCRRVMHSQCASRTSGGPLCLVCFTQHEQSGGDYFAFCSLLHSDYSDTSRDAAGSGCAGSECSGCFLECQVRSNLGSPGFAFTRHLLSLPTT